MYAVGSGYAFVCTREHVPLLGVRLGAYVYTYVCACVCARGLWVLGRPVGLDAGSIDRLITTSQTTHIN